MIQITSHLLQARSLCMDCCHGNLLTDLNTKEISLLFH